MLVREFVNDQWMPACRGLRECTLIGYRSALDRYILPEFGASKLDEVSAELIELWMAGIPTEGAARKAWAVFRSILRKAIRWGLPERDPTIQVSPVKRAEYRPEVLDARQIRQLLQGFYGHPLGA